MTKNQIALVTEVPMMAERLQAKGHAPERACRDGSAKGARR